MADRPDAPCSCRWRVPAAAYYRGHPPLTIPSWAPAAARPAAHCRIMQNRARPSGWTVAPIASALVFVASAVVGRAAFEQPAAPTRAEVEAVVKAFAAPFAAGDVAAFKDHFADKVMFSGDLKFLGALQKDGDHFRLARARSPRPRHDTSPASATIRPRPATKDKGGPMKRSAFLVLVLAAGCTAAPPPPPPAPPPPDPAVVRSTIDATNAKFADAMVKGDVAAAVAGSYANDAVLMMADAPKATGKDAILGLFTGMLAQMSIKAMTFRTDDVMLAGDIAVETGGYQVTLQPKKGAAVKDEGKFLTVWKKQADGSWKIIRDISNSNPPATPAK